LHATQYTQPAPGRKNNAVSRCATGLNIPSMSEPVLLDLARLTAGGAEVHRRIRRSVSLCNRMAELAGLGCPEAR
jgi:hypothetical protein